MAAILEAAQTAAEADKVGMWAPDACGVSAAAEVAIGTIRYDADGNDNENLNDEWVEFTNPGNATVDLTGWSVKDESASHRYYFPNGFTLAAGATVRLHTGCGTDTGDTVFLLDPAGNIAASESY